MPGRPTIPFDAERIRSNVPPELADASQWVCWRLVTREGKLTKQPMQAFGDPAKANDPATWCDLTTALQAAERTKRLAGVGFVFSDDDPFCGIDLDDCRNPETGEMADWAREIIAQMGTYAEVSPSGNGVKLFLRGRLAGKGRRADKLPWPGAEGGEVEVYDRGRYFVVTGERLSGTPAHAERAQAQLDALVAELWPEKPRQAQQEGAQDHQAPPLALDDHELVARAKHSKNGAKFAALWAGDISAYGGDESRADLALVSMLVWWCNGDTDRTDRLFRQSDLYREKWERDDYRQATLDKALATCEGGYNPQPRKAAAAGQNLDDDGYEPQPQVKQSTQILSLAKEAQVEAFRSPDGNLWLAVPERDHLQAMPLGERGGGVTLWLTRLYADANDGAVPCSTALAEAGLMLTAEADRPGSPEHDVHLRIAEHQGQVYLDLGRPDWRVVEVNADGWRVVPCPAGLYFRRSRDTAPLPDPDPSGDWQPLLDLLTNWLDASDVVMVVAWLVAALRPGYPYHALSICGEQGSGKTCLAKLLRHLVDPCGPDGLAVVGTPKDEEAVTAHALGHHVCAFDNLSQLSGDIADCLCRLATGTGVSRRQKYTDFGEALVYVKRPFIVTGIAEVTTRADLLSRFISVTTLRLTERRTEEDLWRRAVQDRAQTLGALLTAASAAMRHRHAVTGPLSRMADAAQWLLAAELGQALPWTVGTLTRVMADNQASAQATAAEASPLTKHLVTLAAGREARERSGVKPWRPTAVELLDGLRNMATDKDKSCKEWPADATRLAAALTRLAPALREAGIVDVQRHKTGGIKWWSITGIESGVADETSSDPIRLSATPPNSADSHMLRQSGAARAAIPTLLSTCTTEEKEESVAEESARRGHLESRASAATLATPYDDDDPFADEAPRPRVAL
ncbi:MAG: hypothetical protein HY855_17820 [Burkholderiales bacterium]|nr:hypothetical protein [Burkholderiales bacterium]